LSVYLYHHHVSVCATKSRLAMEEKGLAWEPTLPLVTEFVKSAETRRAIEIVLAPYKAARPYAAPPGIPKDRALALGTAFADTMKDPQFLSDAEKAKIDFSPMTGARIRELLTQIYAAPPTAIAAARDALEMP